MTPTQQAEGLAMNAANALHGFNVRFNDYRAAGIIQRQCKLEELIKDRDEANNYALCVYCGTKVEKKPDVLLMHIDSCLKHPLKQALIALDEAKALIIENDKLRAELSESQSEIVQMGYKLAAMKEEIAELAEAKADKQRLDWLQGNIDRFHLHCNLASDDPFWFTKFSRVHGGTVLLALGKDLRSAIDAARKNQKDN